MMHKNRDCSSGAVQQVSGWPSPASLELPILVCAAVSLADVYACILRQIGDVNMNTVCSAWVLMACVRREISLCLANAALAWRVLEDLQSQTVSAGTSLPN